MTVHEYLETPETALPQELIYGAFRVADAPTPLHQSAVGAFHLALAPFVRQTRLGRVWLAPVDVILDSERDLVLQPDLLFVSTDRLHIVRDRIWGPPDMVLEVLSPHPRIGRIAERIEWFARYGVQECWLHHQEKARLEILTFERGAIASGRAFDLRETIESTVLPGFSARLADIVDEAAGYR